jgi:hypothetical protein
MTEQKADIWFRLAVVLLAAMIMGGLVLLYYNIDGIEEPIPRSSEDHVWLRKEIVTITATGTAGAATGSASTDRELYGYVYAVHLDFTTGISSTTDIELRQASPVLQVLRLSDYYTDTWYYPVVQQTGSTGAGTSTYEKVLIQDTLDISVCQTTSGTVGTATIYWGQ